jgi:ribosomal protein S18 acetylase RimI-like enzyme
MSLPKVRSARDDERAVVAAVLTDAFIDEDGLNYWLKQGAEKERARRRFFNAAVADLIHPHRDLWLCEVDGAARGAAIWLAPGKKAFDLSLWRQITMTPLLLAIAGFDGAERGKDVGARLAAMHPPGPHAHLVFLGVSPDAQGRGVGSAILKQTLAPLDASGTTAYLECSTERNAALYRRHGFEATGEFELPGLHMWAMTRRPRP